MEADGEELETLLDGTHKQEKEKRERKEREDAEAFEGEPVECARDDGDHRSQTEARGQNARGDGFVGVRDSYVDGDEKGGQERGDSDADDDRHRPGS